MSGGFDPIHSGHIEYFKSAKLLGDKLIVALNSDGTIYKKLNITKFDPDKKDGKTNITFTLDKADQLDFNGKYEGKDVYIKTIDKQSDIESDNKYDEKIEAGKLYRVNDKISPELALLEEDGDLFLNGRRKEKTRVELDDREDYVTTTALS